MKSGSSSTAEHHADRKARLMDNNEAKARRNESLATPGNLGTNATRTLPVHSIFGKRIYSRSS
jgi:hypothetical protein